MKKINIDLGKDSYTIYIEKGLLDQAGSYIKPLTKAEKVAIITDSAIDPLYGGRLEASIAAAGFAVRRIVIPAGEESKNADQLLALYAALADFGISRSDLIITLGGGVPGALGGFAAATYLRGVPFVQIATSIIAQVDSSVGGKVAIDLPSGKNQAGAFYQPKAVLIDSQLLATLPERFIRDGLGEVIKYGCIRDAELLSLLERLDEKALPDYWDEIIETCCRIKATVVEHDVYDTGERMILNFGHTIGHAIERFYGFGHYTHGEGVAAGMAMLTARTEELGLTEKGTSQRLEAVLKKYHLPCRVDAAAADLLPFIGHDKKKRGSRMTLIILDRIGSCRLLPVETADLPTYVRGGK